MAAPLRVTTERLVLRKPVAADAEDIFTRYASHRDALAYMSWPAHESLAATRAFLAFSDAEWAKWPAGPYVILSRADGRLLGATGFAFESLASAVTGYVLARDAWGHGFATEALRAVVGVAADLGVARLTAVCHAANRPSQRVLEKAGFALAPGGPKTEIFPNLGPEPQAVFVYALRPTSPTR